MMRDIILKSRVFVSVWLFLNTSYLLIYLLYMFNIDWNSFSFSYKLLLAELTSLISIPVFIFLYKGFLEKYIKRVKEINKDKIIRFGINIIKGFVSFLVLKIALATVESTIFNILGIEDTVVDNQSTIELYMQMSRLVMFFSVVLFAPVVEELVFRGAIKEVIKNKRVFIAVSGLIFGLMHVLEEYTLIYEILIIGLYLDIILNKYKNKERVYFSTYGVILILLVFGGIYVLEYGDLITKILSLDLTQVIGSITYIGMGMYLAYFYSKNNNIVLNMCIHSLNNLLSFIVLLFL